MGVTIDEIKNCLKANCLEEIQVGLMKMQTMNSIFNVNLGNMVASDGSHEDNLIESDILSNEEDSERV